jgi:hypothetical protein
MRRVLFGALVIVAAADAHAYDQKVHVLLSTRAYGGPTALPATEEATARALREAVYRAGASAPAPTGQRFLARYPALADFDAWEWKRFLGLNPDMRVAGLDDDQPLPAGSDGAPVYAAASRLPDDDQRNQRRYRHDKNRQVVKDPYGQPLPEDPATLEMGSLSGLSSQAHAHYGLPQLQFSDEPSVLKSDPRRFAVPPTVHTFGADYAALYSQLAVVAAHLPGGLRLALTHAGAAAHHVEDVANQIHTVQVGVYDFFVDAKIQSIKEDLRSVGGLLHGRQSFVSIGIDIIANHHSLIESLYAKHLLTPGDPVAALTAPVDDAFAADLARLPSGCDPEFGRAITRALIERSSFEGAPAYAAIRAVADPRLSRAGQHFGDDDDPDRSIRAGVDLTDFYALEARGARRSDQALAAWWRSFTACQSAPAAVANDFAVELVRQRLDTLDAIEARARAWTPPPPDHQQIDWWVPLGYTVAFLVAIAVVRRVRRSRR